MGKYIGVHRVRDMAQTYVTCVMDEVSAEMFIISPFCRVELSHEAVARDFGCLYHNTKFFLQSNICNLFEIIHHDVVRESEDTQPQSIVGTFASCVELCFKHGARVDVVVQDRERCSIEIVERDRSHGRCSFLERPCEQL
jgi:hypothetical protein